MDKKLSAISAFFIALLVALGIYSPKPPFPTPNPTPTATVSPSPSVEPTVTATVTPTPTAEPTIESCENFKITDAKCVDNPLMRPKFVQDVLAAQDEVRFNGNERKYTLEVAAVLRSNGIKATACGLSDEVWVTDGEMSEHYDIVTSNLEVWNKFAAICTPQKWISND